MGPVEARARHESWDTPDLRELHQSIMLLCDYTTEVLHRVSLRDLLSGNSSLVLPGRRGVGVVPNRGRVVLVSKAVPKNTRA